MSDSSAVHLGLSIAHQGFRGPPPPPFFAPNTEWARFLKGSGYYIITKNEGRYNEAVATHLTRPYFAKVERINNKHVEATAI